MKGVSHSLGDAQESCAAAVNHASLLQDVQEVGGVLEGKVHSGNPQVEEFFQGGRSFSRRHTFPQDGEDGALDGLRYRVVGLLDGGLHGAGEDVDIGLLLALEAFGKAGEDAGKDDPGVAAGAHQHPF